MAKTASWGTMESAAAGLLSADVRSTPAKHSDGVSVAGWNRTSASLPGVGPVARCESVLRRLPAALDEYWVKSRNFCHDSLRNLRNFVRREGLGFNSRSPFVENSGSRQRNLPWMCQGVRS